MALKLTSTQYDRLMDEYQQLRFDAEKTLRVHKENAYEKIPELKDLDREIVSIVRTHDRKRLNERLNEIESLRAQLLQENGFPPDYLKTKHNCSDCNDTGFIGTNHCHCYKSMAIRLIYGDSMWTRLCNKENFDTFDMSLYSTEKAKESATEALKKTKEFVSSILNPTEDVKNLILMGNTGVGKTFLCNCVAKDLIENEKFVVFLSAPALFELFENATFNNKDIYEMSEEIKNVNYKNIFECDLLIIDDLGSEFINAFRSKKLLELINSRLLTLPTLISTNLDLAGIKTQYSERLLSRLVGSYSFVQLCNEDIRFMKRQKSS